MGNCLVTKLKESVNNNTLPKFGEMMFNITGKEGSDITPYLGIFSTEPTTVRTSGRACISTTEEGLVNNPVDSISIGSYTRTNIYMNCDEPFTLFVNDQYATTQFIFNNVKCSDNIDVFKYRSTLDSISIRSAGMIGDISNIADKPLYGYINLDRNNGIFGDVALLNNCVGATTLNIYGTGIFGNIESLGNLINCKNMIGYFTKVSGELNNLVNSLRNNGATGTFFFDFGDTNVTVNGELWGSERGGISVDI